jgi:hypothetical protein
MNFLPDLAQYALIVLLCKQQKETMVRASGTVIGIEKKNTYIDKNSGILELGVNFFYPFEWDLFYLH